MANWQVISLDTTTPQLRAPGTGDGYSFNSGSTTLGTWTTTGLTLSTGTLTVSSGTANGVLYLNGSKVATSGSALTFDGTTLTLSSNPTLSGGTVNAIPYLNASKLLISGSALGFNGSQMDIGVGAYYGRLNVGRDSSAPYATIMMGDQATPTNTVGLYMRQTSGASGISTAGADLAFFLGGPGATEAMRLTSSGSLGIGTTSPSAKLSVSSGNIFVDNANGSVIVRNADATNQQQIRVRMSGNDGVLDVTRASGTAPNLIFGTEALERARITSAGVFQIANGGALNLTTIASGNGNISFDGSTFTIVSNSSSAPLVFSTSSTERARITAGGYILLGTTTERESRVVIEASGQSPTYGMTSNMTASSGTRYHVIFRESGTERGSITSDGSSTSYNTSSDIRLKDNVEDANEAGAKIDAIKVRQFDWKESKEHVDYGFIAQELNDVAPSAVTRPDSEENMWSVDYSKLVPMLVKEIQSLRARVAQLEVK